MSINLLTAIFLAAAGFSVGARQIFLSGHNPMWPCAPRAVRVAMFFMAVALAWLAVLFAGHREPYAGEAGVPVAVFAGIMALYTSVMAVNMAAQRRPVDVWRRLNRAWAMSCRPRRYRGQARLDLQAAPARSSRPF